MRRVDHIAIVVDDLDEAVEFMTTTMGLALGRKIDLPERGTRVAFVVLENVSFELIEVTSEGPETRRLGDAPARIEHIAIEVEDADETFAELRAAGVQFTTAAPEQRVTAWDRRKYFFTEPESSDGVMYQFLG